MDSLDPERFQRMARGASLKQAWAGLMAAEAAALQIKVNAVMVRNVNEEGLIPLAELSLKYPWQNRFAQNRAMNQIGG